MLDRHAGPALRRILEPVATRLLSWGVTADAVTIAGTVGVVASAGLVASGVLAVGAVAVAVFALADALDGTMARVSHRSAPWGAFLDSTLDRIADAAVFAALVAWFHLRDDTVGVLIAMVCLATVGVVPYARAKAEALGVSTPEGIAARADRLGVAVMAVFAVGVGAPVVVLHIALALLAVGIAVTVGQRVVAVRRALTPRIPAPR